jgi:hypothetical protein
MPDTKLTGFEEKRKTMKDEKPIYHSSFFLCDHNPSGGVVSSSFKILPNKRTQIRQTITVVVDNLLKNPSQNLEHLIVTYVHHLRSMIIYLCFEWHRHHH